MDPYGAPLRPALFSSSPWAHLPHAFRRCDDRAAEQAISAQSGF